MYDWLHYSVILHLSDPGAFLLQIPYRERSADCTWSDASGGSSVDWIGGSIDSYAGTVSGRDTGCSAR